MIIKMKSKKTVNSIIIGLSLLLIGGITGCDDFQRKGVVEPGITINEQSLSLFVGQTAQLKAGPADLSFSWKSEDTSVATIDANGLVTAVGEGNTLIYVTSGKMSAYIPLISVVKVPLKGFRLSETAIDMGLNRRAMIIPILDPPNANDLGIIEWTTLNENIATVDYKGDITAWGLGKTDIVCTINGMQQKVAVNVVFALTKPFKGPHILSKAAPKLLNFIDFDFGGEGVAYHDNDTGNNGGNNYRSQNGDPLGGGVDIGGDLAVGWTNSGEWLIYTVEVKDAGDYYLSLDLAGDGTSRVRFEFNGVNLTGAIDIPRTGGWSAWLWQDIAKPITIAEGEYKMRFYLEAAGSNFRTMKFTHKDGMPDPVKDVTELLSGKTFKLGAWSAMRDPGNRGSVWWDFKNAATNNDTFTFKADGGLIYDNQGDSHINESLGDLFPDGNTAGSFVTEHYNPPADAKWKVSLVGGKTVLTLTKGFLGYAAVPQDLVETQYQVLDYSAQSIRVFHNSKTEWCFELAPN